MRSSVLVWGLIVVAMVGLHCGAAKTISNRGVKGIQIGGEMPPAGARRYKGMPMRDSLAEEGEYTWRVSTLKTRQGRVIVEEDFFLDEVVNRIRFETAEFHLENGLKVGMTVGDLEESAPEWFVAPLRKYGLYDFYTRLLPGFHFLVRDPSRVMDSDDYESYHISQFSQQAMIEAIVVF